LHGKHDLGEVETWGTDIQTSLIMAYCYSEWLYVWQSHMAYSDYHIFTKHWLYLLHKHERRALCQV